MKIKKIKLKINFYGQILQTIILKIILTIFYLLNHKNKMMKVKNKILLKIQKPKIKGIWFKNTFQAIINSHKIKKKRKKFKWKKKNKIFNLLK